jgi:hypothetical protein
MKKLVIGITLFSLFFFSSFAQQQSLYIGPTEGASIFLMSTSRGPEKFNAKYLDDEWGIGNMQTIDNRLIDNVAFKYNVTRDAFEMRADVNPETVKRIIYSGKVFVHSSYVNEFGSISGGYFELQTEGYAQLLLHYKVRTKPGKKGAFGYEAYQNVTKDYFLKVGKDPAVILKKKTDEILESFTEKREEADAYIQENNLNLAKKKDLIDFLDYYSSLFIESQEVAEKQEEQ